MKALFRHNLKSYALVTALGLLAGFSVVLFIELPDNSFLSFYYWSSSTFGFWVFSTSLIVFFSESRKCAAINAGIYIFNVPYYDRTSIFSALSQRSNAVSVIIRTYANHIGGWLLYSVPPALVCAALGIILWYGRKNKIWGRLLCAMPAVFLFAETVILFYSVFAHQTRFFSALSDLGCLLVYLFVFFKTNRKQQQ